mmetsp:Transcript_31066/g.58259  ORF Transcript_31066/g.58259 Transcript_31066/m.58259 type:complete len:218 (+) Transcript_31066:73-726(+)
MASSGLAFVACLVVVAAKTTEVPEISDSWTTPEDVLSFNNDYMGRHLARLNSLLFPGTAKSRQGGGAEQWLVAFCPSWWEPCHELELLFAEQAALWQGELNTGHFTSAVRFAMVDCATEKVLCNAEGVDMYPTIAHYKDGLQLRQTQLNPKRMKQRLLPWLQEGLTPTKPDELEKPTSVQGVDLAVSLAALCSSLLLLRQDKQPRRRKEANQGCMEL